jgi:hypothetical protein
MADVPFEELVPVPQHRSEDQPDGRVTVLVPRFSGRWARRWVLPLFARQEVPLRLDALGSFVWRQCDGRTSVGEIAARLQARAGGERAEAGTRVITFLRQLARYDSVTFLAPDHSVRDESS